MPIEVPEAIDIEMRGGDHPDEEMNTIEKSVVQLAYRRVLTEPIWTELGFKRAYNLIHLFTFYMTRNPQIIKLLYRLQPYPSYIEMEVTQKCPLKCIMCEHTYWDEPIDELSFKDFKYVMDQFPELKWAGNNALGDPFTNKNYSKMVKLLGERNVNQEIYLTSTLLDEKDMKQFVTMKTHAYVKFSLDAATKETYEKVRKGVDWDRVIRNIKALDYYKKKYHVHWPEIHFHFLIMKQTIKEALDYLDFINDLGIDIGGVYYSRLLHYFPEIKNVFMQVPPDLLQKLKAKGNKLGIPVSFSQDIPERNPPANECVAWTMPYIFPDGTVISCCCMNEQNRRWWQRKTAMGNVFKKPFREIWWDKPYVKMRKLLWQGKIKQAHPVCEICNIYNPNKVSKINES